MPTNANQAADALRITRSLPTGEPAVATLARGLVDKNNNVVFDAEAIASGDAAALAAVKTLLDIPAAESPTLVSISVYNATTSDFTIDGHACPQATFSGFFQCNPAELTLASADFLNTDIQQQVNVVDGGNTQGIYAPGAYQLNLDGAGSFKFSLPIAVLPSSTAVTLGIGGAIVFP